MLSVTRFLPLFFLFAAFVMAGPAVEQPKTLATKNGVVFSGVKTITREDGGKIKIEHQNGISRVSPTDLTVDSQKALGYEAKEDASAKLLKITDITTLDGKVYKGVSHIKSGPSSISFLHENGAATVRFDKLPREYSLACGYDPILSAEYDALTKKIALLEALQEHKQEQIDAKRKAIARRNRIANQIAMMDLMTDGDSSWLMSKREKMLHDAVRAKWIRKVEEEK